MKEKDYLRINRVSWNNKTDIHFDSDFYNNQEFLSHQASLNEIELDLLGNIEGKAILHLQCHFGQDTISLAKLGAKVIGVDFSDRAIDRARELVIKTGSSAEFICCDIYDLPNHLKKKFDVVFTSYGTIGWLPDMDKWAGVIADYLVDGGKLIFAEFHPVVWMFDDHFGKISYDYFNSGPIIETLEGTYADDTAKLKQEYVMWNHGLAEVMNSLISKGLKIDSFNEYDYSPYNCFKGMREDEPKKFRINSIPKRIPLVYSIKATKFG